MQLFEAKPKKWGNALGVTIPREIVRKGHIKAGKEVRIMVIGPPRGNFKDLFGTVKTKKSTEEIMREIDEGYD